MVLPCFLIKHLMSLLPFVTKCSACSQRRKKNNNFFQGPVSFIILFAHTPGGCLKIWSPGNSNGSPSDHHHFPMFSLHAIWRCFPYCPVYPCGRSVPQLISTPGQWRPSLEALEDDFVDFLPETCRHLSGPWFGFVGAGDERGKRAPFCEWING